MYKILNLQQRSPEWHEFRKDKIGGSDAGCIMGVGYETAYERWRRKISGEEIPDNYGMQLGREKEEQILAEVNKRLERNFQPAVAQSFCHPELMASLDGFQDGVFVEIKYTNKKFHQIAKDGFIPFMHLPQMNHNAIVLKHITYAQGFYVSAFEEENHLDIIIVPFEANLEAVKNQMMKTFDFYECLLSFTPPELTEDDFVYNVSEDFVFAEAEFEMAKDALEQCKLKYDAAYEKLLQLSSDRNTKGSKFKILHTHRRGNVDYSLIPQLQGVDLEQYRKKPTKYVRVSAL